MNKKELLNPEEKSRLFGLYRSKMKISAHAAKDEFLNYFKGRGELSVDVIQANGINGMNLTENIKVDLNGQPIVVNGDRIIIHHIILSITDLTYERLMSLVSFLEPFAMKKQDPKARYFTVWDASGIASIRQIAWLRKYYPKQYLDREILQCITRIVYKETDIDFKKIYYINDPTSHFNIQSRPVGFFKRNTLAGNKAKFIRNGQILIEDFFSETYGKEGKSPLIIIENNEESLEYFHNVISPRILSTTFRDFVNERAQQINRDYAPLRKSNI